MSLAIVSGAGGLVGSATVRLLADKGLGLIGIDNDLRKSFFGEEASTAWCIAELQKSIPNYAHIHLDIRNSDALTSLFSAHGKEIALIVHTAAQPSHDWAAKDPEIDFSVNAYGTLNLLEAMRRFCPDAVFIFTSTNKVYGDAVNFLPFEEFSSRYWLHKDHHWAEHGVDETMSIDQCLHSLFGVSKAAADLMVQEYGRYFGLKTGVFRGGCLTGSGHSAAQLHGFLCYVMKSALLKIPYTIFGHKGKQVRDNIHVADLAQAFWHFFQNPRPGEVYNIGGGSFASISVLEAIEKCQELTGNIMQVSIQKESRKGDHQWWVSDTRKFQAHYPDWEYRYTMDDILREIFLGMKTRFC